MTGLVTGQQLVEWISGTPVTNYSLVALDMSLLVIRVLVGTFFFYTGCDKLFTAAGFARMLDTIEKSGIPFPWANTYFVSGVECLGGLALIAGFLTKPVALLLSAVMVVALWTNYPLKAKDRSLKGWVFHYVFLPELLYLLLFGVLIARGAGPWSVDRWFWDLWRVHGGAF